MGTLVSNTDKDVQPKMQSRGDNMNVLNMRIVVASPANSSLARTTNKHTHGDSYFSLCMVLSYYKGGHYFPLFNVIFNQKSQCSHWRKYKQ